MKLIDDVERGLKLATLTPKSRATSLGAPISAAGVLEMACKRRKLGEGRLSVVNIPDEVAMKGCIEFAGKP